MARLWESMEGEPWMDNPRKRRKRKAGTRKRRRTRRAASFGHNPRRRRKAGTRRVRRHKRSFRHNPISMGGIMGRVTEGLKGGFGVVIGKAATRQLPTLAKLPTAGTTGMLVQGGAAVVVTMLAPFVRRVFGDTITKGMVYGAFAAPLESAAVSFNVPLLAQGLSSYGDEAIAALPSRNPTMLTSVAAPGFSIMSEEEDGLVQ